MGFDTKEIVYSLAEEEVESYVDHAIKAKFEIKNLLGLLMKCL
jgi:hypothetical protein